MADQIRLLSKSWRNLNTIKWNRANSLRIIALALIQLSKFQKKTESNLMRVAKSSANKRRIKQDHKATATSMQFRAKTPNENKTCTHTQNRIENNLFQNNGIYDFRYVPFNSILFRAMWSHLFFFNCTRRANNVHTNTSSPSKCHEFYCYMSSTKKMMDTVS